MVALWWGNPCRSRIRHWSIVSLLTDIGIQLSCPPPAAERWPGMTLIMTRRSLVAERS